MEFIVWLHSFLFDNIWQNKANTNTNQIAILSANDSEICFILKGHEYI